MKQVRPSHNKPPHPHIFVLPSGLGLVHVSRLNSDSPDGILSEFKRHPFPEFKFSNWRFDSASRTMAQRSPIDWTKSLLRDAVKHSIW